MNQEPNGLLAFLPLFFVGVLLLIPAVTLAKEKGRNPWKWGVISLIPFVNYFAIIYFIGTPNLVVERKIDRLLELHGLHEAK